MKQIDQALLASLDLVFAQDGSGHFVYVSAAAARVLGVSRDRLLGQTISILDLPPSVIQQLKLDHQALFSTERSTHGEIQFPVFDQDTIKVYEYTFSPVRNHKGVVETGVFIGKDITERKKAETALQASEAKYRSLFEAASDAILIMDASTYGLLNANWSAARKLGYSRKELLRLSIREIEQSFDEQHQRQIVQQLEVEGSIIYEQIYRRKNGTTLPVEINAQLIEYDNQLAIQSFVRDISDRKQAEQALQEKQQQLANIAASIPGTLYRAKSSSDAAPEFLYVSEGERQLSGLTPAEALADSAKFTQTIHPDDRARFKAELAAARDQLGTLNTEYRILDVNGNIKWVQEIGQFSKTDEGDVLIDGVMFDITQHKQAEAELNQQQHQLAAIAANFPGSIYRRVFHADGSLSIPYISAGEQELSGLNSEDVMVHPEIFLEPVHPDDRPALEALIHQSLETLQPIDTEVRLQHVAGHTLWSREIIQFFKTETGDIITDGVSLDVTARKEAQQALQRQLDQERLLRRTTEHIYQSFDLDTILQATADGVLAYLQTERVIICRFQPDWRGDIAAQSTQLEHLMISDLTLDDTLSQPLCVTDQFIDRYRQGQIFSVSDIYASNLSPQFIDYLAQYQVRSHIVVPILLQGDSQDARLWGLLIAHDCSKPRDWQSFEVDLLLQLATQVGIAIQQSELYQQLQHELQERKRAEAEVRLLNKELEQRVAERTRQLRAANRELELEIAERIRVEAALRESEQWFRDLIETTSDIVWEESEDCVIQYISPQVEEILGYRPDELIGKSILDIVASNQQDFLRRDNEVAKLGRQKIVHELTFLHKDGHEVILESNQVSLFDEEGTFIGCRGIDRDITERKRNEAERERAELALRNVNAELQAIFEALPDIYFRLDCYGNYLDCRPKHRKGVQRSLDAFLGHNIRDILPPPVSHQMQMAIAQVIATGAPVSFEYSLDGLDRSRHYEARVVGFHGDEAIAIVRDISDRKRAEEALRISEERMRSLIDAMPFGIWVRDFQDRLIFQNPIDVAHYGQALGTSYEEFTASPERLENYCSIKQRCQQEGIVRYEMSEHISGRLHHFFRIAGTLPDFDGEVGIFGVAIDVTEQKQADLALRESEARFRALFENASLGIVVILPPEYRIELSNPAFQKLLGYSAEELCVLNVCDLTHPDDLARELLWIEECSRQQRDRYDLEKRYIHKTGSTIWVHLTANVVRDAEGQIQFVIFFAEDISARKRSDLARVEAEQALLNSEARHRAILEAVPDLMCLFDRNGVFLDVIRSSAMFDVIPKHINPRNRHLSELLPPDIARPKIQAIQQALATGNLQVLEQTVVVGDRTQYEEVRVVPRDDQTALVLVRDISDRKRTEQALLQSQQRYAIATRAGRVGVWEWDLETNDLYLDPILKEFLGYADHEIPNHLDDWSRHIHPDDRDRVTEALDRYLDEHTPIFEIEHRMLHRDGSTRWFLSRGTLLSATEEPARHLIGTDTDITQQKQAALAE